MEIRVKSPEFATITSFS